MRVGLVGCGVLGKALGTRLIDRGHPLLVHDKQRSRADVLLERGAHWAESPAALAGGVEMIVTALPFPEDAESVALGPAGLYEAAPARTIHVETSTIGPACALRLAREAAARRIRFLDGPISRGPVLEKGASLVMWIGGDANHFDLARPVLEGMADRVMYCGGAGQGQVTKLANNLVTHALTVAIGEAFAIGVRAGASLEMLRAALHDGTAQNRLLDELLPASLFRGDFAPGFRLVLAEKDLRLAAEMAHANGIDLVLVDRLLEIYRWAIARGWGEESAHAVVRLIEESAGVTLRSAIFERLKPGSSGGGSEPTPR